MMEAARTSEMSIDFYQTTRRNNPEDSPPSEPQIILCNCVAFQCIFHPLSNYTNILNPLSNVAEHNNIQFLLSFLIYDNITFINQVSFFFRIQHTPFGMVCIGG
ncbi:hypothetical protein L798_06686 [Zootermopsis nevadensis]|uniref:Uncharacterized protein n=1 Tax=Zootermopsis nevadensis TaxID=136037 RepID=A0A067R769_ZOONE|nr:hypothetical protein L798_06686 [Zootermopsis nevadensis]